MSLPNPSYVSLVTAVITFLTALTGFLRILIEKKKGAFLKKPFSL